MTDEELAEIEALLLEVKDRAEALGAEFYCMFPPQKSTVFTERAQSLPVLRPTPNRHDDWRGLLSTGELADNFVDVLPALQEADEIYPTYYKTDFHWNSYGATVAFTELVNRIAGENIFSDEDYQVQYGGWFQGGQLNNFSTLRPQGELQLGTDKYTGVTMTDRTAESPFRPATNYWVNSAEAPLGSILMIGDSYTLYLMSANSGVLDNFSEVCYLNMNHVDYADILSKVENGQFDYVLFEKIECGMYNYAEILKTLLGQ